MPTLEWADLTWEELRAIDRTRCVALLPVGAVEAHGPHLPLVADAVIATEMARRGAKKLKTHGVHALILPAVSFTVSEFSAPFAGTISVSPETSVALLRDVCISAARTFRAVALVNVHLEPVHVECVKKAVEEANKAGANVCYTDFTKKRWADQLGAAFQAGDHAGAFETSLMMAAAPDKVRVKARISLPPMDALAPALKKGAKTF
ncbi:MAG TPA: creatininase family protein, partial [Candidatus Eisenbacteria bacterium]|nr:creatininase family protein [Candidatus Eisenbacteria bacterium]